MPYPRCNVTRDREREIGDSRNRSTGTIGPIDVVNSMLSTHLKHVAFLWHVLIDSAANSQTNVVNFVVL